MVYLSLICSSAHLSSFCSVISAYPPLVLQSFQSYKHVAYPCILTLQKDTLLCVSPLRHSSMSYLTRSADLMALQASSFVAAPASTVAAAAAGTTPEKPEPTLLMLGLPTPAPSSRSSFSTPKAPYLGPKPDTISTLPEALARSMALLTLPPAALFVDRALPAETRRASIFREYLADRVEEGAAEGSKAAVASPALPRSTTTAPISVPEVRGSSASSPASAYSPTSSPSPLLSPSSVLPANLALLAITYNHIPLPWTRLHQRTRPTYNALHLAPQTYDQVREAHMQSLRSAARNAAAQARQNTVHIHWRRQAKRERQRIRDEPQQMQVEEFNAGATAAAAQRVTATYDMLRPVARGLVRWRLGTFYGVAQGPEEMDWRHDGRSIANERLKGTGIDWEGTAAALKAQKRRHERRVKRTLGLLPQSVTMRGLHVLSAVHRAAEDAGVPALQLMLAIEALATYPSSTEMMAVQCLIAQKQWDALAAILVHDQEYLALTKTAESLFGRWEQSDEVYADLCRAASRAVAENFVVLEYEYQTCARLFCFLDRCRSERTLCWKFATARERVLDGMDELETEMAKTMKQQGPKPKGRRKSVRLNVPEEQNLEVNSSRSRSMS